MKRLLERFRVNRQGNEAEVRTRARNFYNFVLHFLLGLVVFEGLGDRHQNA